MITWPDGSWHCVRCGEVIDDCNCQAEAENRELVAKMQRPIVMKATVWTVATGVVVLGLFITDEAGTVRWGFGLLILVASIIFAIAWHYGGEYRAVEYIYKWVPPPKIAHRVATAYCLKDATKVELTNVTPVNLKNGKVGFQGECPLCGTRLLSLGLTKVGEGD